MYRIAKTFRFEAAHHLTGLPEGHKCARPHGHSYTAQVTVVTGAELTGPGFVVDFAELTALGIYLDTAFDHQDLNTVLPVTPTSENVAAHLFHWCTANLALPDGVRVEKVRVSETASTFAEYTPVPL